MELKQLEAFVSVADCLSFSKAAESLYLTQPTVSAHISSLEKELGTKLFDRTTKSLKLTGEGKKLYPYASRILELKETAESLMKEHQEVNLCVGASTVPASYLLPDIIAKFNDKYPETHFRIRQGNSLEIEEMTADGTVELGIIGQEPSDAKLTAEKLCRDRIVLVIPANEYFTKLWNEGAGPERFLEEPVILREDGSGTQKAADRFLQGIKTAEGLNITARCNNQETIKRMVAAGAGVSVMSYYAARDLEATGKVYCCELDLPEDRDFYIIYRKDRSMRTAVGELIKTAREIYNTERDL